MKKIFLSILVLLFASVMAVKADKKFVTSVYSQSGLFDVRLDYYDDDSYEVYITGIYEYLTWDSELGKDVPVKGLKDLVIPAKLHAHFVDVFASIDIEKDFDVQLTGYNPEHGWTSEVITNMGDTIIETITFEEGIDSIPNMFYLRYNDIPHDMLDETSFARLKKVTIPATVTYIGDYAFEGHNALEEVEFTGASALTGIGTNAFRALCDKEMDIELGEIVSWHSALKSFEIPATVTAIGEYAFQGQENLKELTLGEQLSSIGAGAFGSTGIEELTLDKCNSLSMTASPFQGCPIKKVTIEPKEGKFAYVAEVPAHILQGVTSQYDVVFGQADKDYELIEFGAECFSLSHIKSLALPTKFITSETSQSIKFGEKSFYNAAYFKSLDLSGIECDHEIVFEQDAFGYSNLQDLKLNNKVSKIGYQAFANTQITELVLPQYVDDKGSEERMQLLDNAFYNTKYLKSAKIQTSLNFDGFADALAPSAFERSGIESIELPASLTKICARAFSESKLKEFVGGANLEEIEDGAFLDCEELTRVDISATKVEILNQELFAATYKLQEILFPEKITLVRNYAFHGCGIKELAIPADHPDGNAFTNMPNLEKLSFTNPNLETLVIDVINGCPKLTEVDFGSAKTLDKNFISNCPAYTNVVLTPALKNIQKDAFEGIAPYLKKVIVKSLELADVADQADAPFRSLAFDLEFDKAALKIPRHLFADAHITNSPELHKDLWISGLAFKDAEIDSIDWHYSDVGVYPYTTAQVKKLTFSEITKIPDQLFEQAQIMNLYLDGIEEIGEKAFKDASLINFARKNTLFIPASVKKIGKNAFEGIATAHLHIEKGEGLEIGDEAFLLSTPGAAFNSITCDYTKDNIPVAAANSFKSDGLVSHIYLPSCDDVDAYKAATGWKDINIFSPDAWDGSSVYKIDVEVIGEQNKRPLSYYAGSIFINGTAFADNYHISCDNKVTVDFSSPCADVSIDHWNDPEAKTTNYSLTLTSDTVIKLYVKETYDTYTLELRDPAFADQVKFYMRDKNAGEWVEQSVGYRNSCVEYDSVKVVILDPDRYDFLGWYKYDALADKYDSYKYYRAVDIPEKTDKLFAEVGVRKYQLYCEIEPGDDVYTDHLEFNGGNLGTYILEQIEWGAPVTIQFFGVEMGGNRYVLDYWEDKYTYTSLSEDNPYEFIMPTEDLNIRPVIKPADLFTITAKANDETLGTVKMTVDPSDKDGDRIWERAPIELEAEVKGDHINFVKWNDDAGEQSTWQIRTVYAKKDFEYVAIFEKDSFDVVINLLGGVDDKIVEVKGAGRYGWGDEVTLSFTLKDDHYHFEDWGYDSHSYTDATHKFTIEKNMTIDARFNPNEYTITLVAEPAEGGTVTLKDAPVYGALVTIKAEPNEGYVFDKWKDDASAEAERKVVVEGDATYTAVFKEKTPTDLEEIVNGKSSNRKLLIDGVLFIERNGKTYDSTGRLVK